MSYSCTHSLESAIMKVPYNSCQLPGIFSLIFHSALYDIHEEGGSWQKDLSELYPRREVKFKATAALQFTVHLKNTAEIFLSRRTSSHINS